ncbi:hypothetical protein OUZ56_020446 [Daphnia magna]|uniref:Uncharacterized protein n=1 Tax=Daphnia magna TaxID=35525 RepID=A0ABQ9ZEI0_9CRUS|nr:hypothetical protein OUZ56_020446 [Daphnia magna]
MFTMFVMRIVKSDDQVYFDEAADQPRSSATGYLIGLYVILCSIIARIGLLSHHSFVIFKTNMKTYWSLERLPTHYVIHRASNKDILLKECKRSSQHFWIFKPKLHSEALAVQLGTIAILELIWKKDNLNSKRNLPIENCGQIASIIYKNFKRPNLLAD